MSIYNTLLIVIKKSEHIAALHSQSSFQKLFEKLIGKQVIISNVKCGRWRMKK
jgi:hypothetical protein